MLLNMTSEENAVDACGEEFPFFDTDFEFRSASGCDGISFSHTAFAYGFQSAFQPTFFLHPREQGIDPSQRGVNNLIRLVCQLLSDEVSVH